MNIKSLINKFRFGFGNVIILIIIIIPNTIISQAGKPDLIITNVELKYIKPNHIYKPGEPVSGSDNLPRPRFNITIKNIGNEDFSDAFYIAYTNDERDIRIGRYSHFSIVNTDKNTIKAYNSLIVQVGGVYGNQNYFRFYIPSDGKPYNDHILPSIDEANYDNNTYECSFPNFKQNIKLPEKRKFMLRKCQIHNSKRPQFECAHFEY